MPNDDGELAVQLRGRLPHPGTAPPERLVRRAARQERRLGFPVPPARHDGAGRRQRHPHADHRRPGHAHSSLRRPAPRVPGRLFARLDGPHAGPELKIGQVRVDAHGRLHPVDGLDSVDPATAREADAQRRRSAKRSALKRIGGPVMRRLKPATRKRLRRMAARLGAQRAPGGPCSHGVPARNRRDPRPRLRPALTRTDP